MFYFWLVFLITWVLIGIAIAEKAGLDEDWKYSAFMLGWPLVLFYRAIHNK